MGTFFSRDQRGIGHIGIILAIVVVLVAGGVGWWVWQKNKNDKGTATQSQLDAVKNAKCDYEDKDICKFFASWKATDYYTMSATTEAGDKTSTITAQSEGDDKTHITLGGELTYEIITIGNVLYTKAGDTWYKQTLAEPEIEEHTNSAEVTFTEPSQDDEVPITYKKIGTEKCGDHTCFKYQIMNDGLPGTTQYIWFDDKNYQLRRVQVSDESSTYDATFNYEKVSIKEPSPVKDLAPNQYIVPGQSEPTTLPSSGDIPNAEDLQNLMNQY